MEESLKRLISSEHLLIDATFVYSKDFYDNLLNYSKEQIKFF